MGKETENDTLTNEKKLYKIGENRRSLLMSFECFADK